MHVTYIISRKEIVLRRREATGKRANINKPVSSETNNNNMM
jgi:hypothetical protein